MPDIDLMAVLMAGVTLRRCGVPLMANKHQIWLTAYNLRLAYMLYEETADWM